MDEFRESWLLKNLVAIFKSRGKTWFAFNKTNSGREKWDHVPALTSKHCNPQASHWLIDGQVDARFTIVNPKTKETSYTCELRGTIGQDTRPTYKGTTQQVAASISAG